MIDIVSIAEQPLNAFAPISVIYDVNTIDDNFEHPLNELSPIFVIELPNTTSVNSVAPSNA